MLLTISIRLRLGSSVQFHPSIDHCQYADRFTATKQHQAPKLQFNVGFIAAVERLKLGRESFRPPVLLC